MAATLIRVRSKVAKRTNSGFQKRGLRWKDRLDLENPAPLVRLLQIIIGQQTDNDAKSRRTPFCRQAAIPDPRSGLLFGFTLILLTHQPIDGTQRERGRRKAEHRKWCFLCDVDEDELSYQRQERYQHHRPYLDDAMATFKHAQYRVVELECDEHGHNHAENRLEEFLLSRIHEFKQDQAADPIGQMQECCKNKH